MSDKSFQLSPLEVSFIRHGLRMAKANIERRLDKEPNLEIVKIRRQDVALIESILVKVL